MSMKSLTASATMKALAPNLVHHNIFEEIVSWLGALPGEIDPAVAITDFENGYKTGGKAGGLEALIADADNAFPDPKTRDTIVLFLTNLLFWTGKPNVQPVPAPVPASA